MWVVRPRDVAAVAERAVGIIVPVRATLVGGLHGLLPSVPIAVRRFVLAAWRDFHGHTDARASVHPTRTNKARHINRRGRIVFDRCFHIFSLGCYRGRAPAPSVCALYSSPDGEKEKSRVNPAKNLRKPRSFPFPTPETLRK